MIHIFLFYLASIFHFTTQCLFPSTVNRKMIHSTHQRTFFEILKSSSATAISVLSHVFRFLFAVRRNCVTQRREYFTTLYREYTFLYFYIDILSSLCLFYFVYVATSCKEIACHPLYMQVTLGVVGSFAK